MVYDLHGTCQVYDINCQNIGYAVQLVECEEPEFYSLWKIFSSLLRGSRIGDPDSLNIELWCVFFRGMQSGKAKNQITPVESRDYQKSNIIHR